MTDSTKEPTADRIAELTATITELEAADAPAHMADAARTALSRLRDEQYNCMCGAGDKPCPGPDGRPLCDVPSPAPSRGPQDVRAITRALLHFEKIIRDAGRWSGVCQDELEAALAQFDAQPGAQGVRELLEAIIVRCTEGDKRSDWLPIIERSAREALAALAQSDAGLVSIDEDAVDVAFDAWMNHTASSQQYRRAAFQAGVAFGLRFTAPPRVDALGLIEAAEFRVGEPVIKSSGYDFPGVVRAVFATSGGAIRYVVEHSASVGLLHIFNESQLAAAHAKSSEKDGAR